MRSRRRVAVRILLGWLSSFPGETWQQRWISSGIEEDPEQMKTVADEFNAANGSTYPSNYAPTAATWMIALDVLRPSYEWLHRERLSLRTLYSVVFCVRDPEGEKAVVDAVERHADSEIAHSTKLTPLFPRVRLRQPKLAISSGLTFCPIVKGESASFTAPCRCRTATHLTN